MTYDLRLARILFAILWPFITCAGIWAILALYLEKIKTLKMIDRCCLFCYYFGGGDFWVEVLNDDG